MGYYDDKKALNRAELYYDPIPTIKKVIGRVLVFFTVVLVFSFIFNISNAQVSQKQAAKGKFVDCGYQTHCIDVMRECEYRN